MPIRILPPSEKRKARRGQFRNTQRENRLEELGRVDAEKAYTSKGKRNLKEEKSRIRKELNIGGSAKLTPSETRRKAGPSAARPVPKSIRDRLKDWKPRKMPKFPKPESKVSPGRPGGKGKESPDKRWNKGDKFMTPLRAKKGIGGAIKKIITKIKPKPKPKNVDKLLKNLGDEIKAAPLPPQLKKLVKEKRLSKAFPHHDSAGKLKKASGGRIGYYGGGRTRLLEELGRVEAEPSNRNRRAEISRVHGELNKGYKSGGAVLKGKKVGIQIK